MGSLSGLPTDLQRRDGKAGRKRMVGEDEALAVLERATGLSFPK
jgi:hypothetical protein